MLYFLEGSNTDVWWKGNPTPKKLILSTPKRFSSLRGGERPKGELVDPGSHGKMAVK